ncbi:hypothetical protein ACFE04_000158 [Oxalis oulophora]
METPSSTRRVTRSQTLAGANTNSKNNNIPSSRKIEDSCDKGLTKSRPRNGKNMQQDRSALIDITNDSPIVGLASGNLDTPSSTMAKQRSFCIAKNMTPGSGEALLRGQVKTLLQKVEEEAELSKLSLENRPFLRLQGIVNSPFRLIAPTPMNTPMMSENGSLPTSVMIASPVVNESLDFSKVVVSSISAGIMHEQILETEKSLTRSLMLDFSEKSEMSDSSVTSVVTCQGQLALATSVSSCLEDDAASSIWSIQANASTQDEDEEDEIFGAEEEESYYDDGNGDDEEQEVNSDVMDDLCAGLNNMSMMPKFAGKHIRFVYDSDDEIIGEEETAESYSPGVLRLKGLPTPKGKHVRFGEEN